MARLLDQVIGHEKTKLSLHSLLGRKHFFSGAIFTGPEGVGKKKLALAALQELNCEHTPACGECETCLKIEKSEPSFLHLIEPEKDRIKIEQIRDAIQYASLQSWVKHRFIVIDQIEKITGQAANALLKSLEEPPQGVHFIFITSSLSQVMATLRSRCQVVAFEALKVGDLQKLGPELEHWQSVWCMGRWSLALKIQQPEWLELRKLAINFFYNHTQPAAQKTLIESFSELEKVDFIIHCWLTYVRDALLYRNGQDYGFYNSDIPQFVEKFAQRENLSEIYDNVSRLRQDIVGNVEKSLIVENFSMSLAVNLAL